ncbi:uncharacterized protein [Onthophagus taurus]|uniref:uncharacterized protein n=1 Tax=Onthophagus taurus TaxID=166361 RepID=UPI0039BDCC5A
MLRNVEIKAKLRDLKGLKEKIKKLTDSDGVLIHQHDTFFKVSQGRLKLRQFQNGDAEIISYNRPDDEGPKLSSFEKCDIKAENVDGLKIVLSHALGVFGVVKKTRELYLVGQTRIHLDSVDELGNFVELEVVLKPEQSLEEGNLICNDLMGKLGIEDGDLLKGAYRDLLENK